VANVDHLGVTAEGRLSELVYELLDAHADTVSLMRDRVADPGWCAHLDYLRDLQRVGREVLARVA
jgi:hypothetical protein